VAIRNKNNRITVSVLTKTRSLDGIRIGTLAQKVLKEERIARADLNIILVGDPFMRKMNQRFFSKNKTTDVLSFDLRFQRKDDAGFAGLTADIVVCAPRAAVMARRLKVPLRAELARYIIHGILHLTGYDDTSPSEKKKMWKRQEFLLKKSFPRI
jgi:probable rRNA maturation factor